MADFGGFEEFSEDLEEFALGMDRAADGMTVAVEVGTQRTAKRVTRTAKRLVPEDEGELKRDIEWIKFKQGEYHVGVTKEYGPSVEYGSKPHPITPDTKEVLHFFWEREGIEVFTKLVRHPGTPAQPFLRPALNRHRETLVDNLTESVRDMIGSVF